MNIVTRIRSAIDRLTAATQGEDVSGLWLLADLAFCKVRYHVSTPEYLRYKFYRYRNHYRKNFLLLYHQAKGVLYFNSKAFTHSKYAIYEQLSAFYFRDMILAPACGEDAFVDFARTRGKIVIKPDKGSRGRGVAPFVYESDEQARQFFRTITVKTVCEELIRQHEDLNALNSSCVNSLRILTFRSEDTIDVLCAALKLGASADSFVDNYQDHGICAQIDLPTGIISTFGVDKDGTRYANHPISGRQIIGFKLPHWDTTLDVAIKAHAALPPEYVLLGWDIAITETGACIVEANTAPGTNIIQVADGIPKGRQIVRLIDSIKHSPRARSKKA